MKIRTALVALPVGAALALTGCSSPESYGVKGTVVSKHTEKECKKKSAALGLMSASGGRGGSSGGKGGGSKSSGKKGSGGKTKKDSPGATTGGSSGGSSPKCRTEYEINVSTSGGMREVDVKKSHYNACSPREKFPACTKG